jgi:hypothetical protein
LILVVLITLFGFQATRAWKLINAFLKWVGVFTTGLLTLDCSLVGPGADRLFQVECALQ